MNQLFIICGLLFAQEAATPQEEADPYVVNQNVNSIEVSDISKEMFKEPSVNTSAFKYHVNEPWDIDLNSIVFIEDELEEVDLGFDTKIFLPEGFNPYETYFDIHSITYIEESVEVSFDYDITSYLPENFNPNSYYFDIHSITYIDDNEEEVLEMGYDTAAYLPRGFNPYEPYFNIHSLKFEEEEEEIVDLGFDTKKYLPENFDPYQKPSSL